MTSDIRAATMVDLHGDDLGTMRGQLPPGRSPEGTEHLYVLQFGDLTKIGMTNNPVGRFVFHRNSNLRSMGGPLTRAWVSAAHASATANEDNLRMFCRSTGGKRWFGKHEVFTDLADRLGIVIQHAAELTLADPTLTLARRAAPNSKLPQRRSVSYARGQLDGLRAVQDLLTNLAVVQDPRDLQALRHVANAVRRMADAAQASIAAASTTALEGASA
jgi:hypothetical protein